MLCGRKTLVRMLEGAALLEGFIEEKGVEHQAFLRDELDWTGTGRLAVAGGTGDEPVFPPFIKGDVSVAVFIRRGRQGLGRSKRIVRDYTGPNYRGSIWIDNVNVEANGM